MSKQILLTVIAVAVVVGGGSFYGGMKYGQSNPSTGSGQESSRGGLSQIDFQNLRNLSPEERQKSMQELGVNSGFRGDRLGQNGGLVSGEIISNDDKSITIKLRDGGSKIIFVADSTSIMKSAEGSLSDLIVGKQVTVTGSPNSDGSITAQSVQMASGTPQPAQ